MDGPRYRSYREFWPFYVSQHMHPTNRALHVFGTGLVHACLAAGILASPRFLALAPVVGYGFAWFGHFFCEKNRPATFTYPLWSLRGDFRMFWLTLLGRMPGEVEKARHQFAPAA